ncbi:MAG: hypothetical protein KQH83_04025, partial [Actinobacteria bacterium]|nr:hypothetical protein [Actinomycetota bacterium]
PEPEPEPLPEPEPELRPAPQPAAREAAPRLLIDGPAWCYVLAPTDVLDLSDHTRTIGALHPGTWYLAKRQVGAWVQVAAGEGVEGWVAATSIHRHG